LLDRERDRFRAVIGATEGRPVVVDDARTILGGISRPGAGVRLDESAANELLQRAGLAAPARRHITALARAAAQAMAQ
jgi:carbon-monoxide dehydrogenase medium subunit